MLIKLKNTRQLYYIMTTNIPKIYDKNTLIYSSSCKTSQYFMIKSQEHKLLQMFELVCIDGNETKFISMGLKITPTILLKGNSYPIVGGDARKWLDGIISKNPLTNNNNINGNPLTNNNINGNPLTNNNNINGIPLTNNNINGIPLTNNNNINGNPLTNNNNPNNNPLTNNNNPNNNSSTNTINKNPLRMGGIPTPIQPPSISNNKQPLTQKGIPIEYRMKEMSGISDDFAYLATDMAQPKNFLKPDEVCAIYTGPSEKIKMKMDEQIAEINKVKRLRDNDNKLFKENADKEYEQTKIELENEMKQKNGIRLR